MGLVRVPLQDAVGDQGLEPAGRDAQVLSAASTCWSTTPGTAGTAPSRAWTRRGAFRTRAYAHFDDQPATETIEDYRPMLDAVRATMVAQDGKQPGEPVRGARAVDAAVGGADTPRRLVLGGPGYEAVTRELEATLADVRAREQVSRSADHPAARRAGVTRAGAPCRCRAAHRCPGCAASAISA
ncbi:hypothetical protein HCN51_23885 [Nonomuraea sp. FMUSA5-5]|uniref:Uncharacterized protein n=1 Tax=Nonomuraea composti TaxID=2720023 RepID=A0ABX1B861_9ACTN|nr:hypothetical protein [Nonomuraea sp. FMUSA5-5]NJP92474.1 hypothetical protein [Nonomuraea sp. FMUSA5-5]